MASLPALLVVTLLQVGASTAVGSPSPAIVRTFQVTSMADQVDARPGDGVCRTSSGHCTLRAAVQESNRTVGGDLVVLPQGVARFGIASTWPWPQNTLDLEMSASNGDLDVTGELVVRGAGSARTAIDGNLLDRVFSVHPSGTLTLQTLTVTRGDATRGNRTAMDISDGGGVLNAGRLTLESVAIVGNRADGGGGVFSNPFTHLVVRGSLIAQNTAVEGGGLRIDGGAHITDSAIRDNHLFARDFPVPVPDEMVGYGGGIDHRGTGNMVIERSSITGNSALKAGGGYNTGQNYFPVPALTALWPFRTYLRDTEVRGNTAAGRPSDCHASSMVIRSEGATRDSDGSCTRTG